jgi:spermidine synthase
VAHAANVRLVADDARSMLLASRAHWDVIMVDLVLPWTNGAGALFSREFYQIALTRLAPGGLFAQWLPLHQLEVRDLEGIVATFTGVFPHVQLWVAYHRTRTPLALLVGSAAPLAADARSIRDRLRDPGLNAVARSVGLEDADDLAVLYVTDGAHLHAATRDVPPITDDDPRIEFNAPRGYFHQERLASAALAWIAARLDPDAMPIDGARPVPFRLRADLLAAQLALLAGEGPAELRAYLDALAVTPETRAVRQALAAIAAERTLAGDRATTLLVQQALDAPPPPAE